MADLPTAYAEARYEEFIDTLELWNYGARPMVHLWLDASVNSLAAGLKFIAAFRLALFTINDTASLYVQTQINMAAEQRKLLGMFYFIFIFSTILHPSLNHRTTNQS